MVIDLVLHLYEKIAENPAILSYSDNEIRELVDNKYSNEDINLAFEFTSSKFQEDQALVWS